MLIPIIVFTLILAKSKFNLRLVLCRDLCLSLCKTNFLIFQALSQDKDSLMKLKKSVKDIHQSGVNHVGLEMELSKALDKLGDTVLTRDDEEDDIGAAFQKFAVVTKEMAALMKNMVRFQTLK